MFCWLLCRYRVLPAQWGGGGSMKLCMLSGNMGRDIKTPDLHERRPYCFSCGLRLRVSPAHESLGRVKIPGSACGRMPNRITYLGVCVLNLCHNKTVVLRANFTCNLIKWATGALAAECYVNEKASSLVNVFIFSARFL